MLDQATSPGVSRGGVRRSRRTSVRTPPPTARQDCLANLRAGFRAHHARYERDREAARQLTAMGAADYDRSLDPAELAAYTAIASVLLNLDEAITKE